MTLPSSTLIPTPTLLIVDDQARMRKSLREWLQAVIPSAQCFEVSDGEQAIKVCRVIQPDLILMDIRLPGINGIEATRLIKKDSTKTRIVMLTSYEETAYETDALQAGASAFIRKRQMAQELLPIITKLLAPTPPPQKDTP